MRDTENTPEENDNDLVIFAGTADAYWLLEGEHHLDAILSGTGPYPTPIQCVAFESQFHLSQFLEIHDVNLGSLWAINPAIIKRLNHDDELVKISPPDAA